MITLMNRLVRSSFVWVAAFLILAVIGCNSGSGPTIPTDPQAYIDANGIRGGQFFDKFWSSGGSWDQSDTNLATYNDNADFFRCKQCHGWDLLGNKGAYISRAPKTTRPNVSSLNLREIAAGRTPQALFDALKASVNRRGLSADLSTYDPDANSAVGDQMPDYSEFFTDAQLWDLAKFLKTEAVDTASLYDSTTEGTYPTGSISFTNIGKDGDAVNGNAIYAARCASCHGADGRAFLVDHEEYTIGSFIRKKGNEAQQKIKFGQLGTGMGSLVTDDAEMKDLYKALADPIAFPDPVVNPQGYDDADGFNGGQAYDKFWVTETGWDQDDPNLSLFGDNSGFFQCKQCHGWDLLGNKGAYISRAPKTTRANVTDLDLRTISAGMTPQELFDSLKSSAGRRALTDDLSTYDPDTNSTIGDMMPDIGSFMTDGQIWELVKFLKTEAVDTATLYDSATTGTYPTGSIEFTNIGLDGDAANGNSIYANLCAGCHGADGTTFLVDHDEYTIGSFFRQKANEAQHKVKFGQLGSAMGGLVTDNGDLKDVYKALSDPIAFPDPNTDPQGYTDADGLNGGQLYDKFWEDETGWDQGDPNLSVFGDSSNFFRCKQCHGWDLLGNMGAYISRAPSTTRPNVTALDLRTIAAGMTPQELFDALKSSAGRRALTEDLSTYDPDTNSTIGDQMPDIGSFFTDAQIWDIVKFFKEEAVDTATLYDSETTGTYPTGSITFSNIGLDGDAAAGNTAYTNKCAGCHGADGTTFLVDGSYSIGSFIRGKANEGQHKMKFGQLGSSMGGLVTDNEELKNIYKACSDPIAFPDP